MDEPRENDEYEDRPKNRYESDDEDFYPKTDEEENFNREAILQKIFSK